MALRGGQVQMSGYVPDYSGVAEAANAPMKAMSGLIGQVGDYFKQQGEKKKLIKQSDIQIDAALKLFPELAPSLQSYRDAIRDENIPLDERATYAVSTSDMINNSLNMLKTQASMDIARQREARMAAKSAGGGGSGEMGGGDFYAQ